LPTPVTTRAVPEKFLVAFSFAGEQRDLVRSVAEAVEGELGASNVFFDEWYEYHIAGDDADIKLQKIYGKMCVLAVVGVSGPYGEKPWTKAEHAAIRARKMTSGSSDSILPLRVGEGDVDGILFNAIVPDIRFKPDPVAYAVRMILDRLRDIDPSLITSDSTKTSHPDWPEEPLKLEWPVANHTEVRAAFERLLTRSVALRVLLVSGPSETGKSHLTRLMFSTALNQQSLTCGQFDFKGTTDLKDTELNAFVDSLGLAPPTSQRLNERLGQVLNSLKQRARPTLLIFDTYEAAGEAKDWVEKQLLPNVIRAPWLRVVICGQTVPGRSGSVWESVTAPIMTLKPPAAEEWFEYGKRYNPALTLKDVKVICKHARDKASLLQQMLGEKT
jgi:hypothetical protein